MKNFKSFRGRVVEKCCLNVLQLIYTHFYTKKNHEKIEMTSLETPIQPNDLKNNYLFLSGIGMLIFSKYFGSDIIKCYISGSKFPIFDCIQMVIFSMPLKVRERNLRKSYIW